MSSLSQLLNTARDGLTAQSYALGVTGQNVSNANTPGYVRREALLETRALGSSSTGTVQAAGLRRVTDAFIERREYESNSLASAASEHDQQLSSLEDLYNDTSGTGLSSVISQMFGSFSNLAANPSDTTVRQTVLDGANSFATSIRNTADSIAQTRQDLLQKAQSITGEINKKADAIAKLNRDIAMAETQGSDAADLKDQRDQILLQLSSFVDVRTITNGAGSLIVQSSGTTLVDGDQARSLSVDLANDGSLRILASRTGGPPTDVTKFLTGGTLAGVREARDVDLADAANKLDQFAFDVATAVNTQHQQGFGTDGKTGRKLFDLTPTAAGAARAIQLSSDVAGNPAAVAASGSASTLPGGSDNAAALSNLASVSLASGGTRTAAAAYGDMVGDVASRRSASKQVLESQDAIHAQVQSMHEAMSGVSLDEEFVNLTKFQRAYEASSRVVSTVDELMQTLLNTVGR